MQLKDELVAEQFDRASSTYQNVTGLQADIGKRLVQKALFPRETHQVIELNGAAAYSEVIRWLDIGCGPATIWSQFNSLRSTNVQLWGLDLSYKMLSKARNANQNCVWVKADMNALPIKSQSMDALMSSFALHWSNNWRKALSESIRVLKPKAQFAIALPVDGSFSELVDSWRIVDNHPHVHSFPKGDEMFTWLFEQGVSISSWQETKEFLYFDSVKQMVLNLRDMGVTNQHPNRYTGLTTRGQWQKFLNAYEDKKTETGLYPLSYCVLWIYGKKLES